MASSSPFTDPRQEEAYIRQKATELGLDPEAVFAVAAHEGITLPSQVGDSGTSFGPWQLHQGGRLPASIAAQGPSYANAWANSQEGIDYALQGIAQVARGLRGPTAVQRIVYGFENPKDPASETRAATATYTQGGGPGPNISGMIPTNPYDPVNATIGAGKAVIGGISSVGDLIRFLTSWRFAEVLGGFLLLIVGLLLLGRQFGMNPPAPPAVAKVTRGVGDTFDYAPGERDYAATQRTSSPRMAKRKTRRVSLPVDERPAPRVSSNGNGNGSAYDEVPF